MEAIAPRPKESRFLPEGNYNVVSFSDPKNYLRRIGEEYKPVIAFPGWGITLKTEEKFFKDVVEAGKDVHALDYSRVGGKVEGGNGLRNVTTRKAEAAADYMQSLPSGKYDLFVQSEGAMVALAALMTHPKLMGIIGNIVIQSGAGFDDHDNLAKLIGRYVVGHAPQDIGHWTGVPINKIKDAGKLGWGKDFAKRAVGKNGEGRNKGNVGKMTWEAVKYVSKNPVRALQEAYAISEGGYYEFLDVLKANGINVAFIQGESDKLTPADKLWDRIGEGYPMQIVKDEEGKTPSGYKLEMHNFNTPPIHSVTMVGGGHDNRIYAEKGYAKKIVKAFDDMDDKAINEARYAKKPFNTLDFRRVRRKNAATP